MATVHCFTHSYSSTCAQLVEKLKEFSEEDARMLQAGSARSLPGLQGASIVQCVVSNSLVAFLTEDGRVCRTAFSEKPPAALSMSSAEKDRSEQEGPSSSSVIQGSFSTPPPLDVEDRVLSSVMHRWGTIMGSSGGTNYRVGSRGRFILRRRGSSRPLLGRWPIVPASEVPDELVDQALAVLQGKSREIVVRELQRTNLDVNQAVNNLLSRDDDEGGDGEQEEGGLIGIQLPSGGEELFNLLGSGTLGGLGADDDGSEEGGRGALVGGGGGGGGGGRDEGGRESRASLYDLSEDEIRSWVSLGDGAAGGGHVSAPGQDGSSGSGSSSSWKKKSNGEGGGGGGGGNRIFFNSELHWWPTEGGLKFKQIAGLFSDLIAVDEQGRLHKWAWQSPLPSPLPHPAERRVGLEGERVRLLAGRLLLASVVTESGKLATWVDESVGRVGARLERRASAWPELASETVSQLHVCELFSALLTESGKIFWWGVLPFNERKLILQHTNETSRSKFLSRHENIVVGSKVCLRSKPLYSVGTKAIQIKGGVLQCGILQESVFSINDKCRFQVLSPADRSELEGREGREGREGMEEGRRGEEPEQHIDLSNITEAQEVITDDGQDKIIDSQGDDYIETGRGDDTVDLSSGGADTIAYNVDGGEDGLVGTDGNTRVTGFTRDEDKILFKTAESAITTLNAFLIDGQGELNDGFADDKFIVTIDYEIAEGPVGGAAYVVLFTGMTFHFRESAVYGGNKLSMPVFEIEFDTPMTTTELFAVSGGRENLDGDHGVALKTLVKLDDNGEVEENYVANILGADSIDFTPESLTLTGDGDDNVLTGGAGDDTLSGLGGDDTLTGGAGDDIFVLNLSGTNTDLDTVVDFSNSTGNDDEIRVDTTNGNETTLAALKTAANIYWEIAHFTDNPKATNDSGVMDTIIYSTAGTADTSDDFALMVLEDYTTALTIADFDII